MSSSSSGTFCISNLPQLSTALQITSSSNTANSVLMNHIISTVVTWVKQTFPNFATLSNDIGFLEILCSQVESMVAKNNSKSKSPFNKQGCAVQIYTQLFSPTPEQLNNVIGLIDYLAQHNLIQQKISKKGLTKFFSQSVKLLKRLL
jgi:hypothetical protein